MRWNDIPIADKSDADYLAYWRANCIINSVTGCWEWQGFCLPFKVGKPPYPKGYAVAGYRRRGCVRLSRLILAWKIGRPLLPGHAEVARHTCDVPYCINPDHLIPGSQTDNIQDYVKAGKQRFGKRTACSRGHEFTPETCRITKQMKNGKEYTVRQCKICALGYLRLSHGWPEHLAFTMPPQALGYRPPEVRAADQTHKV